MPSNAPKYPGIKVNVVDGGVDVAWKGNKERR